jgi:PIN domain nuclease of toxin-antitoxin system
MILLDPHVWLWLLHEPSQLSDAARIAIDTEEPHNGLLVSAISVWEIAVKYSIGKLTFPLIYYYRNDSPYTRIIVSGQGRSIRG